MMKNIGRVTACSAGLWCLCMSGFIDVQSNFGLRKRRSTFTKVLSELIHFPESRNIGITLQ